MKLVYRLEGDLYQEDIYQLEGGLYIGAYTANDDQFPAMVITGTAYSEKIGIATEVRTYRVDLHGRTLQEFRDDPFLDFTLALI